MTCPKCGGEMRRYERNGVDVDQCSDCRGIFLDKGELERLTEAEANYYDRGSDRGRPEQSYSGGHGQFGGHRSGKRKKGFLGELFE